MSELLDPFTLKINSSRSLNYQVASLLLYQDVFQNPLGMSFLQLLNSLHHGENLGNSQTGGIACLQAYGQWFRALAATNQTWQEFIIQRILLSDNPFSRQVQIQDGDRISPDLLEAVKHDLRVLQRLYQCSPQQISQWVKTASQASFEPITWQVTPSPNERHLFSDFSHWDEAIAPLADHYRHHGTGLFAQYRGFQWQDQGLQGIAHPDPITLEDLAGYEEQKAQVVQNTEFLLAGWRSLDLLLYGGRGTGKSSLIKALLSAFGDRGLRLIEVSKAQLHHLPRIVEQLRPLPQKFIIFVDDLSFEEDDDDFKALKVILEGSLSHKPKNVVVYATSNRRHLIREFFQDRPQPRDAEEVHQWDTVQEKLSFSDRFGRTITFGPANQDTYLKIIHHLAAKEGLTLGKEDLEFRAKQWAHRHNGRSGRSARQFIHFLKAELHSSP